MKCLEKDRTRRYETANGLATDIQRHLADEPVLAGAAERAYRLRKFVPRNRGAVMAAAADALALLVAGIVGTTVGLFRARAGDAPRPRPSARKPKCRKTRPSRSSMCSRRCSTVSRARWRRGTIRRCCAGTSRQDARPRGGRRVPRASGGGNRAAQHDWDGLRGCWATTRRPRRRCREAIQAAARELHIGDSLEVAATLNNLGEVTAYAHRSEEALRIFGDVLAMRRRLLKGDHRARGRVAGQRRIDSSQSQ